MSPSLKVRTAVIPAAGRGERLAPLTAAVPKELLPVVDRPMIDYAIDEAASAGIERVVVVLTRAKHSLRRYLEGRPRPPVGKGRSRRRIALEFVTQDRSRGLGAAIAAARKFVAPGSFAVILPDEILLDAGLLTALIQNHERCTAHTIAVATVPEDDLRDYGVAVPASADFPTFALKAIVEKPKPGKEPSRFAAIGRYVFAPSLLGVLQHGRNDPRFGLSAAINLLIERERVEAFVYEGVHYDAGTIQRRLHAELEIARQRALA